MSWVEWFAFITGVLTLVLLSFEGGRFNKYAILNWPVGIASTVALLWVFFDAKLYADVTLQVFFVVTGFIGWYEWLHGGENKTALVINTLTNKQRILTFIGLVIACLVSGYLFDNFTDAAAPYVDSIVTGMSIVAQILLMRKIFENWIIWVVMDVIAIGLYFWKGLYITTALYTVFLVMSTYALIQWSKVYKSQVKVDNVPVVRGDSMAVVEVK